jgi:hypothetical protein
MHWHRLEHRTQPISSGLCNDVHGMSTASSSAGEERERIDSDDAVARRYADQAIQSLLREQQRPPAGIDYLKVRSLRQLRRPEYRSMPLMSALRNLFVKTASTAKNLDRLEYLDMLYEQNEVLMREVDLWRRYANSVG